MKELKCVMILKDKDIAIHKIAIGNYIYCVIFALNYLMPRYFLHCIILRNGNPVAIILAY